MAQKEEKPFNRQQSAPKPAPVKSQLNKTKPATVR